MTKINGATLAALAILIPVTISLAHRTQAQLVTAKTQQPAQAATVSAGEPEWVASAPGRVEPMGGSIAIGATMSGRVSSVIVEEGQKVSRGDILVQLQDEGAAAQFQAARIEAARSKKDRDDAGGGDSDYRVTEDDMNGGAGNDKEDGGAGADSLKGGAGADTLAGGAGSDTMTGGMGHDVFVMGANGGKDIVTDFTVSGANGDQIDIHGSGLNVHDLQGVLSRFTQMDANAVLDLGHGNTLTLDHVDIHSLTVHDFVM